VDNEESSLRDKATGAWSYKHFFTYFHIYEGAELQFYIPYIILKQKWREDGQEEVSSYWITLRKREYTGNYKHTHQVAMYEELALEKATDLSKTDYGGNEWHTFGTAVIFQYRPRSDTKSTSF
jgi:hypothetical protein